MDRRRRCGRDLGSRSRSACPVDTRDRYELPGCQLLPAGAGSDKAAWQRLLPIFTAPGNSALNRRVVLVTNRTLRPMTFSAACAAAITCSSSLTRCTELAASESPRRP